MGYADHVLLDRTDLVRTMAAGKGIGDRMRMIAVWQFLNFLRDQSPVATGSPIQTLLDRVRNLVLLAEERDLRQVPDAALQMNAVRLMTIHGSKGLEFEAVHIPGFVKTGIPASYRGPSCPVPEGMIAGAVGDIFQEAERAHKQEQECLFFVALSRARTFLRLYAYQRQANGGMRNPSDYEPRLAGKLRAIGSPETIPLPGGKREPKPVELTIADDWRAPIVMSRPTRSALAASFTRMCLVSAPRDGQRRSNARTPASMSSLTGLRNNASTPRLPWRRRRQRLTRSGWPEGRLKWLRC